MTVMLGTAEGNRGKSTASNKTNRGTINKPLRSLRIQTEDRTFWKNTIHMALSVIIL